MSKKQNYKKEVVAKLKDHVALKTQMKNREEQQLEGVKNIFTTKDTVEQNKFTEDMCMLKIKQMERVLEEVLDGDSKKIIDMRYLSNKNYTDSYVYNELYMCKNKYYDKKREALRLIAKALGIIS